MRFADQFGSEDPLEPRSLNFGLLDKCAGIAHGCPRFKRSDESHRKRWENWRTFKSLHGRH